MKTPQRVLSIFVLGLMVLNLSGCGKPKSEKAADGNLTQEQKDEKDRLEKERQQKRGAKIQKVLVEHRGLNIVSMGTTRATLRMKLELNDNIRQFVINIPINNNVNEEYDIMSLTDQIQAQFPNHFLEVGHYRFKQGAVNMLALEIQFTHQKENSSRTASQYILMIFDHSIGDKAIVRTSFQFPPQSKLRDWAKNSSTASMDPESSSGVPR